VAEAHGDGSREVGIRLSEKAPNIGELRRLFIPPEGPKEIQLDLVDAMSSMSDAADSDLADAVGEEIGPSESQEESASS